MPTFDLCAQCDVQRRGQHRGPYRGQRGAYRVQVEQAEQIGAGDPEQLVATQRSGGCHGGTKVMVAASGGSQRRRHLCRVAVGHLGRIGQQLQRLRRPNQQVGHHPRGAEQGHQPLRHGTFIAQ